MTVNLANVVVVLYQPQDVVNIGGVIRVMSNFGLSRLRLVEPAEYDPYRLEGIAHQGGLVISKVEQYADLKSALADCGFVVGATARKRGLRRDCLTPAQVAPLTLKAAQTNTVALLFGREDSGLPNEALDDCHALITIPTDPANPSLNLAQAALVVAYELWLAANDLQSPPVAVAAPLGQPPRGDELPSLASAINLLEEAARLATGTERETMFETLADLLRALYPKTTDLQVSYSMSRLRAVLLRAAPRDDESRAISHLLRHIVQRLAKQD